MSQTLPAETPVRTSTQKFLDLEDIQNDIVLLKSGACALILQVTAVNFGLLSEGEQDALIYAYAGLLNSLTFPIQIVVRSKRKDISSYLRLLKEQEPRLKKPILREQMRKYREFVETTVRENQVLDKKFYIAISFSPLELGVSSTLSQTFKPQKGLPFPKPQLFEQAKTNLDPKKAQLERQLNRLGLKSRQLTTQEILQLFYSLYNPESVGQAFASSKDYSTPLVQAATSKLPVPLAKPPVSPPVAVPPQAEENLPPPPPPGAQQLPTITTKPPEG